MTARRPRIRSTRLATALLTEIIEFPMIILRVIAITTFIAFGARLCAIEIPAGGSEMSEQGPLAGYADASSGKAEKIAETGGLRITIHSPSPAKGYLAQISKACPNGNLSAGDKVLVVIKARTTAGGEGSLEAKLQLTAQPYTAAARSTGISLTAEWTEFPLLFQVETPVPSGKVGVALFCAQAAQTVEVESIRVIRYASDTDTSKFPRIRRSYAGRDADAPWRKAALERIEKIRKTDCSLVITDAGGKPLANTQVKLTLRRHEFGFGSATPATFYVRDSEDGRRYRDIIDRLFSVVVFENDLKDMWWGNDTPAHERSARSEELNKAFSWLGDRHIAVRGHYLMQVALQGKAAKMDNETIRRHFLATAKQRIEFAGGRVCEWDAINHPIAWGGAELLNRRPGLESLDRDVLALARGLTTLPMFVNEDQIFRPGPQSDGTYEYLRALKQAGISIDGLGNQAHVHESYLPSPERMLAITDRFAEVVPNQSITEYDLQTTDDEQLAADYTRDMLIACFSHPAYTSFLLWGFWEGSHWEPSAASWKKDWTILKRGEVLEEWLGKRWRTQVTLTTDVNGAVQWRGFPGWYDLAPATAVATPVEFQVTKGKPSTRISMKP